MYIRVYIVLCNTYMHAMQLHSTVRINNWIELNWITTRLEKKLDENQPREQAGFRSKYSTTDHIHAINQPKEKCREYNIPLCVAFVDYEKAFDSVQTQAILTSLQEQGIEDV